MANELKLYENNGALASVNGDNYTVVAPNGVKVDLVRSAKDENGKSLLDGDFGVIPNTSKPSLFKSGADKIRIAYGFFERHTPVTELCVCNPDTGFVRYVDKCELVKLNPTTGQEYVFASYVASANNLETRNGKAAGTMQMDNNCVKMAEKRAMVSAVISVANLSALFTMDIEDMKLEKAYSSAKVAVMDDTIGAAHVKKLWADAKKAGKSKDDVAKLLTEIGYASSKDITKKDFGNVLDLITGKISLDEYKARKEGGNEQVQED